MKTPPLRLDPSAGVGRIRRPQLVSSKEPAMEIAASPSHPSTAGFLQGPAMEVAASPVSIRPPPDSWRSSRDLPPGERPLMPLVSLGLSIDVVRHSLDAF
uniref:Uncharacterized protein n=1 Tax=Triticum urartu TaxID=4572 RepID=A0A8R7QE73_TRIUA